ncbi:MAG: helix-turn-helix domain-containing protein, partial [Micrococcaceae bacterium]|nr:helix-turn-helix domain-containing protein [Micrococcaceae bacterium]
MSGTLDRLIRILSSFDAERPAMTVAALARRADLPLPTAYRWVERLVGAELLQKDDDGLVRPGLRLWEMASRSAPSMSLARTAMPFLVDVRSVLRQNTQLAVLDDEGVLVLERLSSQGAVVNQAAAQGGGNPLIPALKALRAQLPAGSAVHMGATSQDIIDTALMAMAAQVGRDLGEDLRALAAALARLAREHRGTPMVA